jgi:hypothetical protein
VIDTVTGSDWGQNGAFASLWFADHAKAWPCCRVDERGDYEVSQGFGGGFQGSSLHSIISCSSPQIGHRVSVHALASEALNIAPQAGFDLYSWFRRQTQTGRYNACHSDQFCRR